MSRSCKYTDLEASLSYPTAPTKKIVEQVTLDNKMCLAQCTLCEEEIW